MARQWMWSFAVLVLGLPTMASAQTCASPLTFLSPPSGPTYSGTTCGGADSVSLFCGALDSAGKNDVILRYWLAPPGPNLTSTQVALSGVSGAGFGAILVLYSGACATGDGCVSTGDGGSAMSLSNVPGGTYYMAVTASPVDASGACGTFNITSNGFLPVQLQHFSIE